MADDSDNDEGPLYFEEEEPVRFRNHGDGLFGDAAQMLTDGTSMDDVDVEGTESSYNDEEELGDDFAYNHFPTANGETADSVLIINNALLHSSLSAEPATSSEAAVLDLRTAVEESGAGSAGAAASPGPAAAPRFERSAKPPPKPPTMAPVPVPPPSGRPVIKPMTARRPLLPATRPGVVHFGPRTSLPSVATLRSQLFGSASAERPSLPVRYWAASASSASTLRKLPATPRGRLPDRPKGVAPRPGAGGPPDSRSNVTRDIALLGSAKVLFEEKLTIRQLVTRTDIEWADADDDVDGASLEALVELATLRKQNTRLQVQLVLTFPSFTNGMELFRLLCARYTLQVSEAEMVPIRVQAFHMIKMWITERPMDFAESEALAEAMATFIDATLPSLGLARTGQVLRRAYVEAMDRFEQSKRSVVNPRTAGLGGSLDWTEMEDRMVAEQITVLEFQLYRMIPAHELLNKAWSAKDKATRAPNVLTMINFFNSTSSWFITELVKVSALKARARLLARMINIGTQLLALGNLSSTMALVAALKTSEIKRLRRTWAKLAPADNEAFETLVAFVSIKKNYANMRKHVAQMGRAGFCLPYLGMFLSDLTFLEDGNADRLESGLINFKKWRSIAAVIGLIERHQKLEFSRSSHLSFAAYFSKAERFSEERSYEESKRLERPSAKAGGGS